MGKVSERLNRILLMVPLIMAEEGVPVRELCEKFDLSKAELLQDLNVLWMCGLPDYTPADLIDCRVEGGRVYVSMAEYFERPLTLTRDEAMALFLAGRALLKSRVFKSRGPLGSALKKVEAVLPQEDMEEVERVTGRIDVELGSFSGQRWGKIEEALEKGRNVLLEYYSFSRDSVTKREVEPLSLVWSRGNWYLLGWCHRAKANRLFRLDRIKSVRLTGGEPAARAEKEFYVSELVGEYRPGRRSHHVRLRFSGKEGRVLVEEWPAAKSLENRDGTVTVELRTMNLSWLSSFLLRFGDRFRVESPPELKEMVRKKASELLEVYG